MPADRGIPAPPFGPDLGKGSLSDIHLARQRLRDSKSGRYPIDAEMRLKMVNWLAEVAQGKDERAKVQAVKALLQADALNLKEDELASKVDGDGNRKPGHLQVTVAGTVDHNHAMFARIADLTKSIGAGGPRQSDCIVAGDGVRESVDTGRGQGEDVSEAG